MTKSQCLISLKSADEKCVQYLQLKLSAGDYRGASAVLLEMAEIKAQIAALQTSFLEETAPPQAQ